jgi:uncharacterized membrane protein
MTTPSSPTRHATPFDPAVEAIESAEGLDGPASAIAKQVRKTLSPGAVKDAVSGTWLGHAVHPLLTDLVLGSFLSATLLDFVGGKDSDQASRRLIGVGIAAYGPTALTGANDWADAEPGNADVRRSGLVHAVSNSAALSLYAASLRARRRGNRARGVVLSAAGASVLGAAAYLGGHLTYAKGVRVEAPGIDGGTAAD